MMGREIETRNEFGLIGLSRSKIRSSGCCTGIQNGTDHAFGCGLIFEETSLCGDPS
jgi:hypothetical protein